MEHNMTTLADMKKQITENAASQRKYLAKFSKRFPTIFALVDKINEMDDHHSYIGYMCGGSLTITSKELDGFKGPELLDLLEELENLFCVEFTGSDNPIGREKNFSADLRWDDGTLNIRVTARLKEDSHACRRVQVGVKTEVTEVPQYILECQE
jgi:hypothetical protein